MELLLANNIFYKLNLKNLEKRNPNPNPNQERDIMCNDIPNAFIQAPMPVIKEGEDKVLQ